MSQGLRDRLIGAWTLVSYQEIPVDGSDPFEPLGHEPLALFLASDQAKSISGQTIPIDGDSSAAS